VSAFYGLIGFPVVGIGPAAVTFGLGAGSRGGTPFVPPPLGQAPLLAAGLIAPTVMEGELVASTVADGCLIGWTVVYGDLEPGY
jgi:hypothetical protein